MRSDHIVSTAAEAQLHVRGRAASTASPSELEELLMVWTGDELSGNDVEFIVIVFHDRLWVVPEETPGANTMIFSSWRAEFAAKPCWDVGTSEVLPVSWRMRWLFLPLPFPALRCLPKSTLPIWTRRKRNDFAKLPVRHEIRSR